MREPPPGVEHPAPLTRAEARAQRDSS
jgi:hypothetical protein